MATDQERITELYAALNREQLSGAKMRQALRDIAQAEPIPTPDKAFDFCRDVAAQALSE